MLSIFPIELSLRTLSVKPINQVYPGIVTRSFLSTTAHHQRCAPEEVCVVPTRNATKPEVTCRALVPYRPYQFTLPTIVILVQLPRSIDLFARPAIRLTLTTSRTLNLCGTATFSLPIPKGSGKTTQEVLLLATALTLVPSCPQAPLEEDRSEGSVLTLVLLAFILLSSLLGTTIDHLGDTIEKARYSDAYDEMARMNGLVEAADYDGDSIVSSVCPSLQPTVFNTTAIYRPLKIIKVQEPPTMMDNVLKEVMADLKIVFKPVLPILLNILI